MKKLAYLILLIVFLWGCNSSKNEIDNEIYRSEDLHIIKISDRVYQHISFLNTESFGRVSCNGLVFCNENEAIVFDTPCDNKSSKELLDWISDALHSKVIAVIPTHYHADNLGGLPEFHKQNIPSYAYWRTIEIAQQKNCALPQHSFDSILELNIGKEKVYAAFFGEGHTMDNIVGYFPSEKVLFGGCLIKEVGAGKGNLEEANEVDWSATVRSVKTNYPETLIIVPGHGTSGGLELFDYTIQLFE